MTGVQTCALPIVFGVDGEVRGGEVGFEELDDFGGAADGVLAEIEAELVGASAGGRGGGRHGDDGGAGSDGSLGKLVGQTIAFCGLSLSHLRLVDRRQKTIVCPTLLHSRTSTLLAWASSPSARARVVMDGASLRRAGWVNSWTEITFR